MEESKALEATTFFLGAIEMLAVNGLGEQARFNEIEKTMLLTSIPKMLATIEVDVIEKTSKIMYPAAIIAGFGMYGLRLIALKSQNDELMREAYLEEQMNNEGKLIPVDENGNHIDPDENENRSSEGNVWEQERTINFKKFVRA